MEGFLWKRSRAIGSNWSGIGSNWTFRYFYNLHHQLVYKEENKDVGGFITLGPETKIRISKEVKQSDHFGFEIEAEERLFNLSCETEKLRDKWIISLDIQIKGFLTERLQWISSPLMIPRSKSSCFISGKTHVFYNPLTVCKGCGNSFSSEYCTQTYSFPHITPVKGLQPTACVYCFDDFTAAEEWKNWLDPLLDEYSNYSSKSQFIPFIYHQRMQRDRVELQKKKITPPPVTSLSESELKMMNHLLTQCTTGKHNTVKELLNKGANVNFSDSSGKRCIHLACEQGDVKMLEILLNKSGCDTNSPDSRGYSPLHSAVSCDKDTAVECVNFLLKRGNVNLYAKSSEFEVPLSLARRKKFKKIEQAIQEFETEMETKFKNEKYQGLEKFVTSKGVTALHWAAETGNNDALRILLKKEKMNVNVQDRLGNSPLHFAAHKNRVESCKILITEFGAEANLENYLGFTPMHYIFSSKCDIAAVTPFLIAGGDTSHADHAFGITPFHLLLSSWKKQSSSGLSNTLTQKIQEFLKNLSHVANFSKPDYLSGQTPLNIVAGTEIEHLIQQQKEFQQLLRACEIGDTVTFMKLFSDENYKLTDIAGNTVLHYVVLSQNEDIIFHSLRKGIDINTQNIYGKTAVDYAVGRALRILREEQATRTMKLAAEKNLADTMLSLFKQDPKPNTSYQKFEEGRTALHIAALNKSEKCIQILCENKAPLGAMDDKLCTPLHVAARVGSVTAIKYILEAGGGTYINQKEIEGNTPLHLWCLCSEKTQKSKTVEEYDSGASLLMAYGASENEKNGNKETPLDIAKRLQNTLLQLTIQYHVLGRELIRAVSVGDGAKMETLIKTVEEEKKIEIKLFVNYRDKDNKTPLHWAYEKQVLANVDRLVSLGADIEAMDNEGKTPEAMAIEIGQPWSLPGKDAKQLINFCAEGRQNKAESLIKSQTHPQKFLYTSSTRMDEGALYCAAVGGTESEPNTPLTPKGFPNVVAMLLKYDNTLVKKRTREGNTALHGACRYGNLKCVEYLLKGGSDPDEINEKKQAPIDLIPFLNMSDTQQKTERDNCEKRLQKKKPDFSFKSIEGDLGKIFMLLLRQKLIKRLIGACERGDVAMLMLVIDDIKKGLIFIEHDNRFKITNQTETENLTDNKALDQWRMEMKLEKRKVELLTKVVNAKWTDKNTPLHIAVLNDHPEIIKHLLTNRADPICRNIDKLTPSELAEKFYQKKKTKEETLRMLWEHTNAMNLFGMVKIGDLTGIEDLLNQWKEDYEDIAEDLKANVLRHKDILGFTALHWAVIKRRPKVVKFLLQNSTEMERDYAGGHTPLHLAALFGHSDCLRAILDVCSDPEVINARSDQDDRAIILTCLFDDDDYQDCLLELGKRANVNKSNNLGHTPLIMSAKCGNYHNLRILLDNQANINAVDNEHCTALIHSISSTERSKNWSKCSQYLVKSGADVNIGDDNGNTPLMKACEKGNKSLIKIILSSPYIAPNQSNNNSKSPLHSAVPSGKIACIEKLLENSVNVNVYWTCPGLFENLSPLHLAFLMAISEPNTKILKTNSENIYIKIFNYLVSYQANIYAKGIIYLEDSTTQEKIYLDFTTFHEDVYWIQDAMSWHTLMMAVRNGDTIKVEDTIVGLSSSGKQTWLDTPDRSRDGNNRTLLHWAAYNGDIDCVEKLLKHRAKTDLEDSKGFTPVALAEQENYTEIVELFNKAEKSALVERKLFHIVFRAPKIDKLKKQRSGFKQFLEDNEIPLDVKLNDGNAMLHVMVSNKLPRFTQLLLDMRADVNVQDDDGNTPLHLALNQEPKTIFRILLKAKPKIDIVNKNNQSVNGCLIAINEASLPKEVQPDDLLGVLKDPELSEDDDDDEDDDKDKKGKKAKKRKNKKDYSSSDDEKDKKRRKNKKGKKRRKNKKDDSSDDEKDKKRRKNKKDDSSDDEKDKKRRKNKKDDTSDDEKDKKRRKNKKDDTSDDEKDKKGKKNKKNDSDEEKDKKGKKNKKDVSDDEKDKKGKKNKKDSDDEKDKIGKKPKKDDIDDEKDKKGKKNKKEDSDDEKDKKGKKNKKEDSDDEKDKKGKKNKNNNSDDEKQKDKKTKKDESDDEKDKKRKKEQKR